MGAPCGVWDEAFGIREVRVLLPIGGCVERNASCSCAGLASAKRWASLSALRVVGATAVRGSLFDEARQPHPRDDWREAGGSLQTGINKGVPVADVLMLRRNLLSGHEVRVNSHTFSLDVLASSMDICADVVDID